MDEARRLRETRKVELVETHNLALSLDRLGAAPYDYARWKRALYHAIGMSEVTNDRALLERIRLALELP